MTGGLVLLKILEEMFSEVNVNHSELEITCRYLNSRAPGGLWSLTKSNQMAR